MTFFWIELRKSPQNDNYFYGQFFQKKYIFFVCCQRSVRPCLTILIGLKATVFQLSDLSLKQKVVLSQNSPNFKLHYFHKKWIFFFQNVFFLTHHNKTYVGHTFFTHTSSLFLIFIFFFVLVLLRKNQIQLLANAP